MNHEKCLVAGLSLTVSLLLFLFAGLSLSLGFSALAVTTLLFVLAYPLIWLACRCYAIWCQTIMQLTTYTQVLKEGEQNLRFKKQHPDNLLLGLQKEIAALAQNTVDKYKQQHSLDNLLSHILDAWPVPVCLFDDNLHLTYRNNAMNMQIQQPMLLGSHAYDLGFILRGEQFTHPKFDQHWQCQSIQYLHGTKSHQLFSAINIATQLNDNISSTQQSLVRVLAHELRNSLTPMSSMTDTLLSAKKFDVQQTRLVLTRIHNRSNRLLSFISQYSQLTQLPAPEPKWFNFIEVIDEAKLLLGDDNGEIVFVGNQRCFGDAEQIAQVIINLVKNAQEACENNNLKVKINAYYQQENQVIEVEDNGLGFANLQNVLTPFYTTKAQGSGIGLSLCAEIIKNHHGQLSVENIFHQTKVTGARVSMRYPLKA